MKHPSTGIRLPELFLPGILRAYRRRGVPGELTLSFGRETAPRSVIEAPPGQWEITRGHTGTAIEEYLTAGAAAAREAGVAVELEADHLILIGSQTAALRRLAGDHAHADADGEELGRSLQYYRRSIEVAAATGVVACFTIDASDLYWSAADHLPAPQVAAAFRERFAAAERRRLLDTYARTWRLPAYGGGSVQVTISEAQVQRLALKFRASLQASAQVYEYCREALGGRPFSWEIALDETAQPTSPREALFYLLEWQALGYRCHYLGPHVGFSKRVDYTGSKELLRRRVRAHDAIVRNLAGGLLSIHSGDGANPYSGKGEGTYEAILAGCGGNVKFKISDVYYELLMEHLTALPAGSAGRRLYEQLFDAVEQYLRAEVAAGGPLVTPLLLAQLAEYDEAVQRDAAARRYVRAGFFRFHQFLSLSLRDAGGRRYLREAVLQFVRRDEGFRERFDEAVEALTLRMIDGLRLAE